MADPFIEPFSSGYAVVGNCDVLSWSLEEAHMDVELYYDLADLFGEPIIGMVGGSHYNFRPSTDVKASECAIPEENRAKNPSALLIRR